MKKIILVAALFFTLVASPAGAATWTTVGGDLACLTKEWLDDIMTFVINKDYASIDAYRNQQKCVILKAGLSVSLMKTSGFLGSTVQIGFRGIKLWTAREAIKKR